MILTTGPGVDGRTVREYLGVVFGHAAVLLGFGDIAGKADRRESRLQEIGITALGRLEEAALNLGADAVIAIGFDYQAMGDHSNLLTVSASGTAVRL